MKTRIVKVNSGGLGAHGLGLENWCLRDASQNEGDVRKLRDAAKYLQTNHTPVAFPTETVYGLGADARSSEAVKGIYKAKGRPSDNPLIVHVCDLEMLRGLLTPAGKARNLEEDPIPSIYKPLIDQFWPGPLTILLPSPQPSSLAPEVTAGLPNFGARMPNQELALSLIKLADAPLAAPSANASTKPSPTTAQHVMDDLDGRIEIILDGGICDVGVESTVVDGLCSPPVVLRPGGVSIGELKQCPGWENVEKAYKDKSEIGKAVPRAPGMKYKHYSPKAKVVLYESSFLRGSEGILDEDIANLVTPAENGTAHAVNGHADGSRTIGVIRTQRWQQGAGLRCERLAASTSHETQAEMNGTRVSYEVLQGAIVNGGRAVGKILDINLGQDIRGIAHGVFSALRELDRLGADIIFVDGIDDRLDIAGAVMNRLRKAASDIRA